MRTSTSSWKRPANCWSASNFETNRHHFLGCHSLLSSTRKSPQQSTLTASTIYRANNRPYTIDNFSAYIQAKTYRPCTLQIPHLQHQHHTHRKRQCIGSMWVMANTIHNCGHHVHFQGCFALQTKKCNLGISKVGLSGDAHTEYIHRSKPTRPAQQQKQMMQLSAFNLPFFFHPS